MSSSACGLPANPFSQWKSTTNLDPNDVVVSNLPDEVATLIFSKMGIEQVQVIMENTETLMDRYSLYRSILDVRSSLTGKELMKFQHLLTMEGQPLVPREDPQSRFAFLTGLVFSVFQYWIGNGTNRNSVPLRPWVNLLADKSISLSELRQFDLSGSTNITNTDLVALTKNCKKLTTLILPRAFPSEEVMAVLRTNCPQAAIYPSAMTEHEWAHPAEFIRKLPPPPQEIADFINGSRPMWRGKTSAEAHMVVPRVNKIIRNIDGLSVIVPWTLKNIDELDKAMGGVGCSEIYTEILKPDIDKPSEVGFEWVVFTKDVLIGSRNRTYIHQKQLAEHWGYEVPGFIDATTCVLWENRISGNCIYGDDPWAYTRCKERVGNLQLVVGGFTTSGVYVYDDDFDCYHCVGVGGLRKFKVIQHGDL